MKLRKDSTFVLLLLCVIVWGTIGWKVYCNLNNPTIPVVKSSKTAIVVKKDSISLLLSYRDPFLGDYLVADSASTEIVHQESTGYSEQNMGMTQEVLPDFQYKGNIRIGETLEAIVIRKNENILLNVHDKIGEFKVLSITESVLTVSRAGTKYQLNIQ